jgi:hypothetical protein
LFAGIYYWFHYYSLLRLHCHRHFQLITHTTPPPIAAAQ